MLGVADHGATVRMLAEGLLEHQFLEGVDGTVAVHVLLLIHGFQLALEQTEHGIAETLHIHVHPLGDLVRREDVVIHGLVVGGAGVQALAAHLGEDHVDLIRDGVVGGGQRELVNLHLDGLTGLRVGGLVQFVVHQADAVEIHLLFFPVDGADAVGALEHDVLEVVGHASGVGGVVLAACVDVHGAIHFRLVVVLAQHDLQAVVEVIGGCFEAHLGKQRGAAQDGDE